MHTFCLYIKISCFLLSAMCIQSCKKFVNIKPSPDLIHTAVLFTSDATAVAAVNGVYVEMRASSPSLANGTLSIFGALSADELNTVSSDIEYSTFEQNAVLATSAVVNYQLWKPAYKIIYRTNIILENLQKSSALSLQTKKQLTGEMKVVRALYYFYLTNLFGDVPLIVSSNYRENESKPRHAVPDVYNQIVTDLTEAVEQLNSSYPDQGKLRPNQFTALSLLSRVYLYQKDWVKAASTSTLVIQSGIYELVPLSHVFKKDNAETIWEIASANEVTNTVEGSMFIPSTPDEVPLFYLSPSLLPAFETGDERKNSWTGLNISSGHPYYFPYKYKSPAFSSIEEYNIVLRLAEQYLIRAEARAWQNNIPGAKADLDIIRNRASLPNSTAVDQTSLLEAIQRERQVELFAEWGHRWLDLKRTQQSNFVLSPIKGANWQNTDTLFPIPFEEIRLNPLLVQNPGY